MWEIFGPGCMQQEIVQINFKYSVLPPGTFCPTVPLAGEEAARVVSAQERMVALPLPARVQVLFTTLFYQPLPTMLTFTFTVFY